MDEYLAYVGLCFFPGIDGKYELWKVSSTDNIVIYFLQTYRNLIFYKYIVTYTVIINKICISIVCTMLVTCNFEPEDLAGDSWEQCDIFL